MRLRNPPVYGAVALYRLIAFAAQEVREEAPEPLQLSDEGRNYRLSRVLSAHVNREDQAQDPFQLSRVAGGRASAG